MTKQRKYRLKKSRNIHPGRLSALLLLLASGCPVLSARDLSASVLPIPDGYLTRAGLMEQCDNPLGTIDQLARFDVLTGKYPELDIARAYYSMGDDRCIPVLRKFLAENPASPETQNARMLLGDFYFFNHDFADALQAYEGLDLTWLSSPDEARYSYRKALSLIKTGHFDSAVPLFSRLLRNREYAPAAQFYLAYIDYVNGDYDEAYEGFEKAQSLINETYGNLPQGSYNAGAGGPQRMRRKGEYTPTGLESGYYLLQIDFLRGNYDKVVDNGRSLLFKQPVPELIPEAYRVMGESYFKLGEPDEAREYLLQYLDETEDTPAKSAIYALGVLDYDDGEIESAAERFGQIGDEADDLSQSAYLYMGQCAIKRNDPDLAAIAFRKAYQMSYDDAVAETALYNYIAAVTLGGKVPFASSVKLMREFIDRYPSSRYAPEIERHMAVAYYNEKDYDNALEYISRIAKPSAKELEAKQKILFELGVREMSNGNPAAAEKYLSQALTLSRYDSKVAVQSALWLGDAQYAQKKYAEAQKSYDIYMKGNKGGQNSTLARYNLAYSLYMQDKFKDALVYFDEALKGKPALPRALQTDAMVRKGDCLYYLGNLSSAAEMFAKAIGEGSSDADYAAMRRAVIAGVNGDNKGKVSQLADMMARYPNSKWIPTALLEQALAYAEMGESDMAIKVFDRLSEEYPDTPETRNALLQMALLYSKNGDQDDAITAYRHLISKWPTSEEARLAGEDLRTIYASRGELPELAEFLRSVPGAPQLDADEVEQLTYEAAATAYATGEDASRLMKYVEQYPDGANLAQALRDIAEYQYTELDNPAQALASIQTLLEKRPDSQQVPGALMLKGQILEETQPSNTREILETYREIEKRGGSSYSVYAWAGIMRNTPDAAERMEYARRILDAGGLGSDDTDEANYYLAKGQLDSGRDSREALASLSSLAENPQSLSGSKAAVTLGEYYVGAKEYKKAVQLLEKFTDSGTPHEYWLARGYITLADAYRALGKKQLALEYIRSLKENYPGNDADIASMINKRIASWK